MIVFAVLLHIHFNYAKYRTPSLHAVFLGWLVPNIIIKMLKML